MKRQTGSGRLTAEEQQMFTGTPRSATLMVCPALLDDVKVNVLKEAGLSKNLRKAREERQTLQKKGSQNEC